jgi:hypothetical protein
VSENKRRIVAIPEEPFFKCLFYFGQFAIVCAGVALALGNIFLCVELTWPLLVVVAVALLPFLLPVVCVYVGRVFGIEFNELPRAGDVQPPQSGLPPAPPVPPPAAPEVEEQPIQAQSELSTAAAAQRGAELLAIAGQPHPNALAREEKKVLRTLWLEQSRYIAEGKNAYWGFVIGPGAPDFGEFVRGFGSLTQRGLTRVDADRGLIFLTDPGIAYCKRNADIIDMKGEAWTQFVAA